MLVTHNHKSTIFIKTSIAGWKVNLSESYVHTNYINIRKENYTIHTCHS